MKSFLVALMLTALPALSRAAPQVELHRQQATHPDASGWHLAASTQGSFSVLIPLPFNDFTVTEEDAAGVTIKTHTVGAKSAEGIKFSATESAIIAGKSATDLAALPQQFQKPGQTIADIDTADFAGCPSVAFAVKGAATSACMRAVKTPRSLIILILEYPNGLAQTAAEFRAVFLSSLKLHPTVPVVK